MSKNIIPVLALATVTSVAFVYNNYFKSKSSLVPRDQLIGIIIELRKTMFSTLREIAYSANYIRVTETDIQPRKIKDVLMRDGSSAQLKLNAIQDFVLSRNKITIENFEQSCNYHSHYDLQVKMLLQKFKNDVQLALDGTIETYYGPLPRIDGTSTIKIYREIVLRRMKIIEDKFLNGEQNTQCIKRQAQIQNFLECNGVNHAQQPNQKVFISLLQNHYKNDPQFKQQFQLLEGEFEQFIEEVKKKKLEKSIDERGAG